MQMRLLFRSPPTEYAPHPTKIAGDIGIIKSCMNGSHHGRRTFKLIERPIEHIQWIFDQ